MTSYSKTATTVGLYDVARSVAEDPGIAFVQSNLFWQVSCTKSKLRPVQKSAPGLLTQERLKINLEFRYQIIILLIKFRKCFAKFIMQIALFRKFLELTAT